MPLLEDDKAAGGAARSLGKWGITNAVARILPQLNHEKERRRVLAVNALSDIGEPAAIPYFLAALGDPVFTVRKVARGALARHGADAASAALGVLENAPPVVQREIMGLCVDVGYLAATNALAELCRHAASPSVKSDAQRCFEALMPLEPASGSDVPSE